MADRERMLLDAIDGLALQFMGQDFDEMLADGYSDAEGEQRLLETLARATDRFLRETNEAGEPYIWARGLSAAESAIVALHECGLVTMNNSQSVVWTDEGRRLLAK